MKYKMPVLFYNAVNSIDKEFKDYLNSHIIPFIIDTTDEEKSKKFYEGFIESFNNNPIEKIIFSIIDLSIINPLGKYRIKCFDNKGSQIELYDRVDRLNLNDEITASMVLYKPDIANYDSIKNYSVMEYIYRQLEMCDFIKSPEIERICRDECRI